ncbi:MAG: hypothetical protein ACKO45_15430 [Cyanobium sp.]
MSFALKLGGLTVISGLCCALAIAPAHAATAVCTVGFGSSVAPGATIAAALSGPTPPCPVSPVTVSLNTGAAAGNSGTVFSSDIINGLGTNNFTRTSPTSVVVGSASTNQLISLTFSQPLANPYLFFSFTQSQESFVFGQPFTLAQRKPSMPPHLAQQ